MPLLVLGTMACGNASGEARAHVVASAPPPGASAAGDTSAAVPPTTAIPTEPRRAAGTPANEVVDDDDAHCKPLPKAGSPCPAYAGYCVVDWGSPGGHSTALWCREGTWHLIEEVNLP